jgi:murein DD-endopeptidase MepM/ murein hydrolase activator NlpD
LRRAKQNLALGISLLLALLAPVAQTQSVYKYRDEQGNWVYTDRKPESQVPTEQVALKVEPVPPRIAVEQVRANKQVALRAVNECSCTVEFGLRVVDPLNVDISERGNDGEIRLVVPPRTEKLLTQIAPNGLGDPSYGYEWQYVIGAPGMQHRPREPYRVPYAVGQSFRVTQAYPSTITHKEAGSSFAVDIALPMQTPVYAARAGKVINVAHEHYRGGISPGMMDEANFVQILHDDDTVAMYAHLHWDSIRVRPGQQVQRGEYIADSGNTGFSSGPHLHFAVTRNAGLKAESVPIVFAGPNNEPITPRTGMMLKAH